MELQSQLEREFEQALQLEGKERERFVESVAAKDLSRAAHLSLLLKAHGSSSALDRPAEIRDVPGESSALHDSDQERGNDSEKDWTGGRVGEFRLGKCLGTGGMGSVFEAQQAVPARRVAVKLIHDVALGSSSERRFFLEIETLARLDHSNIAKVFGAGKLTEADRERAWFAMELIEDPIPFVEFFESRNLDLECRLRAFERVLAAVHHAHQRGFLHRDLKSQNILIPGASSTGLDAKVIDFGLARVLQPVEGVELERTRGGELLGTFWTMSPELCAGRSEDIDVRADVYSLGVVLYQLVTAKMPYELEGSSLTEVLRRIREEPPRTPSELGLEIHRDLWAIMRKALAKEPSLRYDGAASLAEDLQRFQIHMPVMARKNSIKERLVLFAKRSPKIAGGVALGGVGALIAAVLIGFFYLKAERALEKYKIADSRAEAQEVEVASARDRLQSLMQGMAEDVLEESETSLAGAVSLVERREIVSNSLVRLKELDQLLTGEVEAYPDLADAYSRIGSLHGGEWTAKPLDVEVALAAFQRAAELWRLVVAKYPEDWEALRKLTLTLSFHVQACRKAGKTLEGQTLADEAVAKARRLVAQRENSDAKSALVSALWARSDIEIDSMSAERGIADSREASRIATETALENPGDPGWQRLVAFSEFRCGIWFFYRAEQGDPKPHFDRAVAAILLCASEEQTERAAFEVMTIIQVTSSYRYENGEDQEAEDAIRSGLRAIDQMPIPKSAAMRAWTYLAVDLAHHERGQDILLDLKERWAGLSSEQLQQVGNTIVLASVLAKVDLIGDPVFRPLVDRTLEFIRDYPEEAEEGLEERLREIIGERN